MNTVFESFPILPLQKKRKYLCISLCLKHFDDKADCYQNFSLFLRIKSSLYLLKKTNKSFLSVYLSAFPYLNIDLLLQLSEVIWFGKLAQFYLAVIVVTIIIRKFHLITKWKGLFLV